MLVALRMLTASSVSDLMVRNESQTSAVADSPGNRGQLKLTSLDRRYVSNCPRRYETWLQRFEGKPRLERVRECEFIKSRRQGRQQSLAL